MDLPKLIASQNHTQSARRGDLFSTLTWVCFFFVIGVLGACESGGGGAGTAASSQAPRLSVQLNAPSDYQLDVLQDGTSAYIDSDHTLTDIPSGYNNLCLLRTANGDKFYTDPGFLTFIVNKAVNVYVGYATKKKGGTPDWLKSWHKTGDVVSLSTAGKGGTKSLHLFSRQFPPGVVSIDGNAQNKYMYVVFLEDPERSSLSACSTLSDAVLSFSWQPLEEDFSGGYRIYQGGSADSVDEEVSEVHIFNGEVDPAYPSIELDADDELGLFAGETTCFSVSAFDHGGESEKSPPICMTL